MAWCDFMQGLVEIPPLGQLTVGKIVTEMYYYCILKLVVNYGNDNNHNHKYHLLQNYIIIFLIFNFKEYLRTQKYFFSHILI